MNTLINLFQTVNTHIPRHVFTKINLKTFFRFCLFYVLPSLAVILFFWQYIFTGNAIRGGDFDYISQAYEAFRVTVLRFGQFPDWNPWIAGGVPLYANPQFGLFSIQSLFVLMFGSIYGLKLAYVFYALCGFWGMYFFGHKIIKSNRLTALLVSFIWIGCGFFYGHNISHFTFALFFLFPWLIVCLHYRAKPKMWLYFGSLVGIIALSSIHYALLMMGVACAIYFSVLLVTTYTRENYLKLLKKDLFFILSSILTFTLIAGHRIAASYFYANNNQRLIDSPEQYASIGILLKSIFTPIATLLPVPTNLQWGWAEYSMYIGAGTGVAFGIATALFLWNLKNKRNIQKKTRHLLLPAIILALFSFFAALGDIGLLSPFNLLHHLPGFTQTRVPSRWMVFVVFVILTFILYTKQKKRLINSLLILGAVELFIFYGPLMNHGQDMFQPQKTDFSETFSQYDNSKKHLDASINQYHSYYISTANNKGQVYADDSLVDTLDGVYNTKRCGINTDPECTFVLTHNASVTYWSPNLIILHRTEPGDIQLNMNPYYAWSINGQYPFAALIRLNPDNDFTISDPSNEIRLEYNPKYSIKRMTTNLHL